MASRGARLVRPLPARDAAQRKRGPGLRGVAAAARERSKRSSWSTPNPASRSRSSPPRWESSRTPSTGSCLDSRRTSRSSNAAKAGGSASVTATSVDRRTMSADQYMIRSGSAVIIETRRDGGAAAMPSGLSVIAESTALRVLPAGRSLPRPSPRGGCRSTRDETHAWDDFRYSAESLSSLPLGLRKRARRGSLAKVVLVVPCARVAGSRSYACSWGESGSARSGRGWTIGAPALPVTIE